MPPDLPCNVSSISISWKNKIKNSQNEFCKGWWKLIKVQGCKSLLTDNNIDQINLIINKITTEYRKYFCCSGALIILSLSKKIQGKLVWKSRTNTSYIFRNKWWSNIFGQLITVLCLLFLSFFFSFEFELFRNKYRKGESIWTPWLPKRFLTLVEFSTLLGLILGKTNSPKEQWGTGKGCSGRWWSHHPLKCSENMGH